MNLKDCLDTVDRRIESAKADYQGANERAFELLCNAVQLLRKVVEQLATDKLNDERTIR